MPGLGTIGGAMACRCGPSLGGLDLGPAVSQFLRHGGQDGVLAAGGEVDHLAAGGQRLIAQGTDFGM
jgi:hypothetical protein